MIGAPLTPLELRLEVSKTASNLTFEFLERLKDRRSIVERYCAGDVNLHIHFAARQRVFCLTVERADDPAQIGVQTGMNRDGGSTACDHEMPVFIRVGVIPEASRPVASLVRLIPLDCCNMGKVDAFEVGAPTPSIEILWRVHNRKLRTALCDAGIDLGEFKDEVIQGAPEVVANLPYQDADAHSEECFRREADIYDAVRWLRIEIEGDSIRLALENASNLNLQFRKVFACPPFSLEAAIKRVNAVIDHAEN